MIFDGIIIGLVSFVTIGIFHPIVIKCQYHFSDKIWPVFLVLGILLLGLSTLVSNTIGSAALGVAGFSCLWSIKELKEQTERVRKGWFPENPRRKKK